MFMKEGRIGKKTRVGEGGKGLVKRKEEEDCLAISQLVGWIWDFVIHYARERFHD